MDARTLLLNHGYEPLRVIGWERAVTLMFLGKVEVLENHDVFVHSPSTALPVPAVVRWGRRTHRARAVVRFTRRNLYLRDDFRCQYCGGAFDGRDLTFDHVVPRTRGGPTSWENVVAACRDCNRRKGARLPHEIRMFPLVPPRAPARSMRLLLALADHRVPALWRPYLPGIENEGVEFV